MVPKLLLIKNGRIIDPSQDIDFVGNILVEGEKIKKVWQGDTSLQENIETVLDANGRWVLPGLVDIHVHLREPGQEDKETILTGMRAAAAGGFTTICAMPNTEPVNDNKSITEFIIKRARDYALIDVWPIGAISRGSQGKELAEIGEMKSAGAVAISDDGRPVMDAQLMRRALEYSEMFDLRIIAHCEDMTMTNSGVMHEGVVSTRLGLVGIPSTSEENMVLRDINLAEAFGGRLHIAHVSTKGSIEAIRAAKAKGLSVTAEVTPHHLFLTDEAVSEYDTNTKMNPPLRTSDDVKSAIDALKDGTIDVIATDHAPHTTADKEVDYDTAPFGIVGLETALPLIITGLYHKGILSPKDIVEKMSYAPGQIIGKECGTLKCGMSADIVIVDPEEEFIIDKDKFFSKAKNTPFNGWKLKGRVKNTISKGNIVYP